MLYDLLVWLDGKKTYLTATAGIVYGAAGFYLGFISKDEALKWAWEGFSILFLRKGISSAVKTLKYN